MGSTFRLLVALGAYAASTAALCANLTIGLGTDVTAIDPHYHNLTPNNNVAAHIYGYLVERNEKSQPIPGLATEWKTLDPTTWEFKLRKGVKFHDGSEFTAADVVASIERVPKVANSPSPFTAYTKQIQKIDVVDPYTIRFKTATPYPLMPTDLTQVAIISKQFAAASTEDFNSGKAAIGTGPYKVVKYTKSDRLELARNDNYWGGKTPWEKVTLRALRRCCRAMCR
jgi:peptide/nickel transport system substrate-binding protein